MNLFPFYVHNRKNIHKNAKRGSGGVGVFVENDIRETYSVIVLDNSVEDILWIKLSPENGENIVVCVYRRLINAFKRPRIILFNIT